MQNKCFTEMSVDRPCKLVLRHNEDLQVGTDIEPGELIMEKIEELDRLARNHSRYNPKITGEKKLLEHSRLNGLNLRQLVEVAEKRGICGYRLVFVQRKRDSSNMEVFHLRKKKYKSLNRNWNMLTSSSISIFVFNRDDNPNAQCLLQQPVARLHVDYVAVSHIYTGKMIPHGFRSYDSESKRTWCCKKNLAGSNVSESTSATNTLQRSNGFIRSEWRTYVYHIDNELPNMFQCAGIRIWS